MGVSHKHAASAAKDGATIVKKSNSANAKTVAIIFVWIASVLAKLAIKNVVSHVPGSVDCIRANNAIGLIAITVW